MGEKVGKKKSEIVAAKANSLSTVDPILKDNATKLLQEKKKKKGVLTDEVTLEKLQYAKILQPTSKLELKGVYENLRPGDLYLEGKVLGNKLTVVALTAWRSRSKWSRDNNTDGVLDCASPDGVTPINNKYAEECSSCPHSRGSRENPSACDKSTNILVVDTNLTDAYVLTFSKTSFKEGEKFLSLMNAGDEDDEVYHMSIQVKTERAKQGAYYVYSISAGSRMDENLYPLLDKIQSKYIGLVSKQINRGLGTQESNVTDSDPVDADEIPDSIE